MPEFGLILQARMGSTRLPGKVLRPLAGHTLLDWIADRLQPVLSPERKLLVATGDQPVDDPVAGWCHTRGIDCFRGSPDDVLDRYVQAMRRLDCRHVVRLTADNPLIDAPACSALMDLHLSTGADYTHSLNYLGCGLPNGLGTEIFTRASLLRCWEHGQAPNHREHVNEYLHERLAEFTVAMLPVPPEQTAPDLTFTVDTAADHARLEIVLARLAHNGWPVDTPHLIRAAREAVANA